ncbi:MAG TPA: transcription antitermination factor NusB [Deltaproteobacteria bacterium]|nr:transcription antitermination factor NusB [Deltaproteobacteria bacterium]
MTERRKAREAALQGLYQMDLSGAGPGEAALTVLRRFSRGSAAHEYCRLLLEGVTEHMGEIDGVIEESSEHWTVERMAVVDRNILRMAVFELLYRRETPYRVVIDEAVELAKSFGADESAAFINGILDRAAQTLGLKEQ